MNKVPAGTFRLLAVSLYPRKMTKSPLLETIGYKYGGSSWNREALAHTSPDPNRLSDSVLICDNNPLNCLSCRNMINRVEISFLQELRESIISARANRVTLKHRIKVANERLEKHNDLLAELDKKFEEAHQKIVEKAEKTVLALRTAPPEVGQGWNWRLKQLQTFSDRPEITPEDQGFPQMSNLREWYERKKSDLEAERKNALNVTLYESSFLAECITKDPAIIPVVKREMYKGGEDDFDVDQQLAKWHREYRPPVNPWDGIEDLANHLLNSAAL